MRFHWQFMKAQRNRRREDFHDQMNEIDSNVQP